MLHFKIFVAPPQLLVLRLNGSDIGSMLDDLIHQMPGVTINDDGQIFVNGRMVEELQLGSRTFMRGNKKVLMENLPYFTVKDIKVYEQDTDLNRAMGYQVDKKKFVMDVNLKPEYQVEYIANVEAAGGTQDRWLGLWISETHNMLDNHNKFASQNSFQPIEEPCLHA